MGEDIAKAHFLSLSFKAGSCLASLLLSCQQRLYTPAISPFSAGDYCSMQDQHLVWLIPPCPRAPRSPHGPRMSPPHCSWVLQPQADLEPSLSLYGVVLALAGVSARVNLGWSPGTLGAEDEAQLCSDSG